MSIRMMRPAMVAVAILGGVGLAIVNDMTRREAVAGGSAAPDQVLASFGRELSREPGPAMAARRESIDEDVLYRTMNATHWTVHEATEGGDRQGASGNSDYAEQEQRRQPDDCLQNMIP
jgi:hypothetical protein